MISAVVNILKPPGMTSHDVVSYIRQRVRQKKVGHCGTLDPAAAGVLPIYLGNATRLVEYADHFDKEYRAELLLGVSTDTGDDTGTILRQQRVVLPSLDILQETVKSFQGGYDQVPPMYSALKVAGAKLYELARSGKEVERAPRRIDISQIRLVSVQDHSLMIQVACSKGTYIRTLCEDIGAKLDLPATLSFLLRTRVGPFLIKNAVTLEEFGDEPERFLLSPEVAIAHLSAWHFDENEAGHLKHGRKVFRVPKDETESMQDAVRLYDANNQLFGIGRYFGGSGLLQPLKIFSDGINK